MLSKLALVHTQIYIYIFGLARFDYTYFVVLDAIIFLAEVLFCNNRVTGLVSHCRNKGNAGFHFKVLEEL